VSVRPRWIASGVVFAALFAIGFLPLFDGPGYEHAIASGLIVPTAAALVSAFEAFSGRHALATTTPLRALRAGLAIGAQLAAVALLAAWAHVLRVGACDPLGGSLTFVLGPGLGAALAGALGALVAQVAGHLLAPSRARRRWAVAVAGLSPLASALFAVWLFWATPAVFAFDPFVGFFSGTLYDEVVDAWGPLLTYRAGTLVTLLAIGAFAASAVRGQEGRVAVRDRRLAWLGAALALGSATLIAYGPELGHRTSSSWIRSKLGGSRVGARCEVVFPASTSDEDATLMLRDCEEEIRAVEARFGARGPERIVAFFFKDAAQKRVLMGAGDVYVAKPWRHEVYLHTASYPHPVLGHELAHVIAGASARGPFRVAGTFGGLVPNPGLIEGVAVAASPERDELTPVQWGRAMKELGLLPKLSRIFGPGFLGENSSIAYTVAGSFISLQLERGRGAAVRAWYGGATFEAAFGRSFADAEVEWRGSLDAAELPEAALLVAKGRFDRPAIWGRRCPHVVERLREDGDRCKAEGRLDAADAKYVALLKLDAVDPSARMDLAKIAKERGDGRGYLRMLAALEADPHLAAAWHARAAEAEGDERLRTMLPGELELARAAYGRAARLVVDEDRARTLEVKRWLAGSPARAALFGRLLIGREGKHDDTIPAVIELARFVESPGGEASGSLDRAFARYLLARRLFDAHAYDEAQAMLADAPATLDEITPRIRREAGRLRVMMACQAAPEVRRARLDAALATYEAAPRGNEGRASDLRRIAARCATSP
jgi:hypothetical protein